MAATPAAAAGDETYDYVALGDSAAAAPLVPGFAEPLGCAKSTNDYPSVLARALQPTSFVDVSCSAAKTSHLVGGSQFTAQGPMPPQLDAVGQGTDLVTVTIGGNDTNLVPVALSCVNLAPPSATSPLCKDRFVVDGVDTIAESTKAQVPAWSELIDSIRAKAPDARIVLVGYGTYIRPGGCFPDQPMHPADADYLQAKVDDMNDTQRALAAEKGIEFFDTRPVTEGHDSCAAPEDRYLEGLVPTHQALPLHPNALGADAVGTALADYLR
ncbi:hypothetical protein CH263_17995 [Rhodococcus sp. 06-1059B-a]|nr:hypothetical protein CH263_17995 [Rhodococcus sp. 06-1059B-a]